MDDGAAMNKTKEHEDDVVLELRDIRSAMKQLLEHSHAQTVSMASMREEMQSMREDLQDLMEKTSPGGSNQAAVPEETGDGEGATSFEDQVIARLDNVENHQKYQEVLLRNQKWEYTSPIPPDGSIDRNARRFLLQLRDATCDIKLGVFRGSINGPVRIIELVGNQLQLHPLAYDRNNFLPHWCEFGNALKECECALRCFPEKQRTIFRIVGVHLPAVILDILSDALWSTRFKSFALNGNDLCPEGFCFALDYLERNPILEELDLSGNKFMSDDDMHRLCGIIRGHPTMHTLTLCGCFGEGPDDIFVNGADALVDIMEAGANKLRHLNLSSNEIATSYEGDLEYCLKSNPILETLSLRNNDLDDEDALSIARVLKKNTHLGKLDLTGNDGITESGWEEFRKVEFDSTSLNSISDSNHTCFVYGCSRFNGDVPRINEEPWGPTLVRQKKIYNLLSARHRESANVQYFHDIPVGLIPTMFHSIEQYSWYWDWDNAPGQDESDANVLSVMFEIARWWDKSFLVYESLSKRSTEKNSDTASKLSNL